MSVDFTYEWLAPIESEGQSVRWYSSFGLADGRLALSNGELGSDREFRTEFHKPVFFPVLVYSFVGPEGGGVGIAIWFLTALTYTAVHIGTRLYKRSSHEPTVA